jgi:hypothetical protein
MELDGGHYSRANIKYSHITDRYSVNVRCPNCPQLALTSTIAITVPAKEQHDVWSPWFSLATDGSSDVDDKYFLVLVTHWHTSGQVVTSFIYMPLVNEADAANITDARLKSLRKVKLDINR